jgi:hypothetical protein
MSELSRRTFLTKGSLAVAAGTVAASVPGLGSVLSATEAAAPEAPELTGAASDAEITAADLGTPLVAHIKDLQSGQISLYQGEREITYHDPVVAARLFRAAR